MVVTVVPAVIFSMVMVQQLLIGKPSGRPPQPSTKPPLRGLAWFKKVCQ